MKTMEERRRQKTSKSSQPSAARLAFETEEKNIFGKALFSIHHKDDDAREKTPSFARVLRKEVHNWRRRKFVDELTAVATLVSLYEIRSVCVLFSQYPIGLKLPALTSPFMKSPHPVSSQPRWSIWTVHCTRSRSIVLRQTLGPDYLNESRWT